jgi:hypothetical protein
VHQANNVELRSDISFGSFAHFQKSVDRLRV